NIGVQRSSVSHVLSGRNRPSIDFINKILAHFPKVDAKWLITGKQAENTVKPVPPSVVETEKNKQQPNPERVSSKLEKESKKNVDSSAKISDPSKVVQRIVIFYEDGTFDSYQERSK